MIKNITCIECPKGCRLAVDVQDGKVVSVAGNQCKKGAIYAKSEIEEPMRILTAAVLARGLSLKMVPVRTDKPIPKEKIMEAMEKIKRINISGPIKIGEIIEDNFIRECTSLISTRSVNY